MTGLWPSTILFLPHCKRLGFVSQSAVSNGVLSGVGRKFGNVPDSHNVDFACAYDFNVLFSLGQKCSYNSTCDFCYCEPAFSNIFYFTGYQVVVLPSVSINKLKCKTRRHCGHLQLFIPDVYKYLQSKWPRGAFCVVGITMIDLYPNESWNFVFGQANPGAGVGVFSFARYDPLFYEPRSVANKSPCTSTLVLWRSCKVVHHFRGSCLYFLDLRSKDRSYRGQLLLSVTDQKSGLLETQTHWSVQ